MSVLTGMNLVEGYWMQAAPERSKQVLEPSSPTRPDSVRVLNRVPMGSRGCPTQPSMLVVEVCPLWSNSEPRQLT